MVIYTPRHDTSFGQLGPVELGRLLALWTDRSRELWADERREFVMIFENRGAVAGATLAHPYGQIYAFDHVPPITAAKVEAHSRFRAEEMRCLGCDVVERESASVRVVEANDSFVVGVPYAARWPYEVAVLRGGTASHACWTSPPPSRSISYARSTMSRYGTTRCSTSRARI